MREESVDCLLGVLLAVDAVRTIEPDGLYNATVVTEALRRYETIWLPLLAQHTAEGPAARLVPPLDVLWASYLHRLAPGAYKRDCLQLFGRVIHHSPNGDQRRPPAMPCMHMGLPGRSQGSLDPCALPSRLRAQRYASQAAWHEWVKRHTPSGVPGGEPYQPLYFNDPLLRCAAAEGFVSRLSVDIVGSAWRQRAFVTNVFNCHILGSLDAAVRRYARFLHLHALHPGTLLVPTYDIDLVWHTHMMHTQHYEDFVGDGFDHDDSLDHADAEKSTIRHSAFRSTCELWREAFPRQAPLDGNPAVLFKGMRTDRARALPEALYVSGPVHHLEYLARSTTDLRTVVPRWSTALFEDRIWTTGVTQSERNAAVAARKPYADCYAPEVRLHPSRRRAHQSGGGDTAYYMPWVIGCGDDGVSFGSVVFCGGGGDGVGGGCGGGCGGGG